MAQPSFTSISLYIYAQHPADKYSFYQDAAARQTYFKTHSLHNYKIKEEMGFFTKLFGGRKSDDDNIVLVITSQMIDEDFYWQIINESLLSTKNQNDQQKYLTKRLQELTPSEIIGFKLRTEKLLYDTYNSELWCAGYIINEGCSDDAFEYFRRWIISRGREVFYKAKSNPDSLISEIRDEIDYYDFESFNQIPDDAFEAKTSKDIYDYIDEVNYDKIVGPYPEINLNWEEENPQSMKIVCPKLFEKKWNENCG